MKISNLLAASFVAVFLVVAGCSSSDGPEDTHDHTVVPDLTGGAAGLTAGVQLYTCGMHPQVVSEEPGTCPICGMRLVPVNPTPTDGDVVEIDPGIVQTIGVRTTEVRVSPLRRTVRATGRFVMDEQGAQTVTLKTGGWVEKLYVDFEGAIVHAGQPMLDLYSPELVTTQEEYLLALAAAERMQNNSSPGARDDAARLVDAARRRLEFFDLPRDVIERVRLSRTPERTVSYTVPISGEVMNKYVVQGQKVEPGQPLMQIYDTSHIWLMADVYEQDLPWIRVGSPATISIPYAPDRTLEGRVEHLYYMLNQETRSAQARIALRRTDNILRPGMYAVVELEGIPTESGPIVPEEAVVWTGERSVVILSVGAGRFRPIVVQVGVQADGFFQILDGLSGGEQIVTSAQFLIDSEARLQSAVGAMIGTHQHGEMTDPDPSVPRDDRMEMPAPSPKPSSVPPASSTPTDSAAGHVHDSEG